MVRTVILLILLTLFSVTTAQESCVSNERIVGEITQTVEQPHEFIKENLDSPWLRIMYQPTRNSTLEKYLVFQPDEVLDIEKIQESIRKLRQTRFIWDASYQLVESGDCATDVLISVTDTFPFKPELSFSRKSRGNNYSIGVTNSNVSGTGALFQFEYKHEKLRDQRRIKYENPNLTDDHYLLSALYSDNSDGQENFFEISKPFHTLDSKYSYGFLTGKFQGELQIYDNREVIYRTFYDIQKAMVNFATGYEGIFDFRRSRLQWYVAQDRANYDDIPELNRNLNSVGARYELFDTDFIEMRNIRNMSKIEDYNKGLSLILNLGYSYDQTSKSWAEIIGFEYNLNTIFNKYSLLLSEIEYKRQFSNRKEAESHIGGIFQFNTFSDTFEDSWNIKLQFDVYDNPRPENYIIMDEEFSIRGYSYGQFLGDAYGSVNIEKRWFNVARYFDVVDVAAVAFYDVGYISVKDSLIADSNNNWLQNIGFGLRISPTKFSNDTVIHVDLSFPINKVVEQNYQINIYAKKHF